MKTRLVDYLPLYDFYYDKNSLEDDNVVPTPEPKPDSPATPPLEAANTDTAPSATATQPPPQTTEPKAKEPTFDPQQEQVRKDNDRLK